MWYRAVKELGKMIGCYVRYLHSIGDGELHDDVLNVTYSVVFISVFVHCVSKKTGPLLPFAITPTVLVQ